MSPSFAYFRTYLFHLPILGPVEECTELPALAWFSYLDPSNHSSSWRWNGFLRRVFGSRIATGRRRARRGILLVAKFNTMILLCQAHAVERFLSVIHLTVTSTPLTITLLVSWRTLLPAILFIITMLFLL